MTGIIEVGAWIGETQTTCSVEVRSLDTSKPPLFIGQTGSVIVPAGQYYVIASKQGYVGQRSYVSVADGQTVKATFRLYPQTGTEPYTGFKPASSFIHPADRKKVKDKKWR